jgi:hypothetical protein
MNAETYLDYLIDTAALHASGGTSIGVQPSELKTLKVLFESEKAQFTLQSQFVAKVTKNGNPA